VPERSRSATALALSKSAKAPDSCGSGGISPRASWSAWAADCKNADSNSFGCCCQNSDGCCCKPARRRYVSLAASGPACESHEPTEDSRR